MEDLEALEDLEGLEAIEDLEDLEGYIVLLLVLSGSPFYNVH